MATRRTPQYLAALEVANRTRKVLGLPPVDHLYPGVPQDAYSCAITETVYDDDLDRSNYIVSTSYSAVKIYENAKIVDNKYIVPKDFTDKPTYSAQVEPDIQIPMTVLSKEFISRFDKKRYRSLIKNAKTKEA